MDIKTFAPSAYGEPGGYIISGFSSVEELLDFRDAKRQENPGYQLLYVLDNEGQAAYTSMHSIQRYELDAIDASSLPENERILYEAELQLTPERWAETIQTNLGKQVEGLRFDGFAEQLRPAQEEMFELFKNQQTGEVFISPIKCYSIRSDNSSMAIAAHPNGYFDEDLTPAQNYLLAEHLRTNFGYEILGLGSCYTAYINPNVIAENQIRQVINSIKPMYKQMADQTVDQWVQSAANKRWLLIHNRGN